MPYSIPAPSPAPLPIHSQGRPGHRRSFSEIAYSSTSTNNMAASTSSNPPPPMERRTSGAFAPLGSLPRRKPASFHLEADDDDDSSPEDEAGSNRPQPTPHPSQTQRRISPNSSSSQINLRPTPPGRPINLPSEDEDDEYARGLPPLKLKIPSSNPALNIPFSPSPTATTAAIQPNTLPFPRTISPPRSRTASMDTISAGGSSGGLQFQVKSPTPTTVGFSNGGTRSGNTTPTRTDSPRPAFPRTASTPLLSNASSTGGPIILSNGKPLKSSLKSSSSSPNIPFPSQSLVPSRIYAEIAKKQAEERERLANSAGNSPVQESGTYPPDFASEFGTRHARAASAPALPSLTLTTDDETLDTCPPTPSAPKAVHFPSSDDGALATVKFFKRSARPASLSVPGASGGEETETETDGEGYNSGPGGGYNGYNANTSWGQWGGGYMNPWDRYTAQNSKSSTTGSSNNAQRGSAPLNLPRLASPLGPQNGKLPQRQPTQRKKVEEKKLVYEVDRATSSDVPRKDLGLFDNVFLEDVQLDAPSTSSSGQDDGSQSKITSLKGTLLVRNLAYEKHVSVRFTLDGWHTTSEVKAEYKESLGKLPAWIVGVLRGDRTISKDDESKPPSAGSTAGLSNPQWDRFTFSIDLSDYARSRSLANRTLWIVVRFSVPGTVRVPLGVPLLSRDFTPIHSSSTQSAAPQLDVMSPSSPDLLSTLISGIAGSPNPSPTSQAAYAKGREIVEEVLRRVRCCVGVGVGNEWWDNNGGGNFRVGFREKEFVDVKEEEVPVEVSPTEADGSATNDNSKTPAAEEGQAKDAGAATGAVSTRPRRANAVSCPPMFSGNAPPPPPMSILDKSLSHSSLSPPQISSSTSLDSASSSAPSTPLASFSSSFAPSASSFFPSTSSAAAAAAAAYAPGGGPASQSGTPKPWPQRTPAANKAMAETTLERLKRLNLRNYAAPSVNSTGRVMAVPPAIVTSPTATTVRSPPAVPPAPSTAEVKVKDFGATNEKVDSLTAPKGDDGLSAEGPPSRTSSVSSTSSWTSALSTDSRSGSGSGSGSETTPMTSPLCTPTSMRSSVWDGATPTKEDSIAAGEETKVVDTKEDEKEGVELEPSFGRVTPRPIAVKSNANDSAATTSKKDGVDLGAFMAGPPSASGEGYDPLDAGLMGTSPPFSMFGAAAAAGRSTGGSVVFGWGVPASKDTDSSSISSVSSSGEDAAKTPTPSTIPLITTKPSNLILDSIREKNVSIPMRSPGGSGRSSPVPGVVVPTVSSSSNISAHFNPKDSASRAPTRPTLVATTSNYTNLKEPRTGSGSDSGSGSPSTSRSGSGGSSGGSKNGSHPRRHGHHHHRGGSSTSRSGLLSPLPLTMTSSPLQSPTSISPSNSFSGLQQGGSANGGSRSNSLDDIRDPDSIYQAFVKQWCFASGPAPQQAGGFGTMNSSSKEAGERKKHAM